MKSKINKLIQLIDEKTEKAERDFLKSKKSALEINASSMHSPSQSGDRYHSQSTAEIAEKRFKMLLALKKEVTRKKEAIVHIHKGKKVYVVDNPLLIPGFKLISSKSELGQKLQKRGKK